ncbi:MAG: hypothetical protein KF858_03340 [Candidatus Sumerlaeia bacterium]|nr:hypothetical protein [Candidatus Sumerlaeia bacterium]
MNPRLSNCLRPLTPVATGGVLLLAGLMPAQPLRLSDVFVSDPPPAATPTPAPTPEPVEAGEDAARLRLANLANMVVTDPAGAEASVREFLAGLPATSPLQVETRELLLRALSWQGKWPAAAAEARVVLGLSPASSGAREVLAQAAGFAGRWEEAAGHYEALLAASSSADASGFGTMSAVEAFVRAGRGGLARQALDRSPTTAAARTFWLLESLLVEDAPDVAVPGEVEESSPLAPAVELRRALLHDLRGETDAARALYAELAWSRDALSEAERGVLDERMAAN